jgi:predicted dinucleotide-utilizing enzyme
VYLGNGPTAHTLAEVDTLLANAERKWREAERAERERIEVQDASVEELCALTDLVVEAALTEAGYHRHRGEWRKRRAKKEAYRKAE